METIKHMSYEELKILFDICNCRYLKMRVECYDPVLRDLILCGNLDYIIPYTFHLEDSSYLVRARRYIAIDMEKIRSFTPYLTTDNYVLNDFLRRRIVWFSLTFNHLNSPDTFFELRQNHAIVASCKIKGDICISAIKQMEADSYLQDKTFITDVKEWKLSGNLKQWAETKD